jgi:hypothetical protein
VADFIVTRTVYVPIPCDIFEVIPTAAWKEIDARKDAHAQMGGSCLMVLEFSAPSGSIKDGWVGGLRGIMGEERTVVYPLLERLLAQRVLRLGDFGASTQRAT